MKKKIKGYFTNIINGDKLSVKLNQFILQNNDENCSEELKKLTDQYTSLIKSNQIALEQLAALEEIIIQMRIKENMTIIKLSLIKGFLYARSPFFRKDKKAKDIRVLIDRVKNYPDVTNNIHVLLRNTEFMDKAKNKLSQAMEKEINENIRVLKTL